MANQLHPQPLRAFNSNGDPVSGARLKFYIADTDTQVTVYSDAALTTPHDAAGIESDAAGNFAAAYYGGANDLKADATKDGSSLPGFPVPRVIQVLDSSSGASNISFTPVTGNANTDVQAAIAANTAAILVIQDEDENARKLLTSAGSSNAYTLTPGNAITAYAAGQVFTFVADRANTGAATLNVSGLGPKDWQKYDDAAALAALASGDVAQGRVFTVMYDGTRFVTVSAIVPDDDALANNGDGLARRDNVKAYVDAATNVHEDGEDATTSGIVHSFTSIPAGINHIDVNLNGVSLSGTDSILIQLSTGGAFAVTGYVSTSGSTTATGQSQVSSTAGIVAQGSGGANTATGVLTLSRVPGTNTWVSSHSLSLATNSVSFGGGKVALGGVLDGVRLTRTGSDTFDAGGWSIRCRE